MKTIAENRKIRYDYFIIDEFSAGIALSGTEVKALRFHGVNLNGAFVLVKGGEVFVYGLNIPKYKYANKFNHEPKRVRKLLLNRREINKLLVASQIKGLAIVISSVFFNDKSMAKVKIALAKGKKNYDKREQLKEKDQKRENRLEYN